MAHTKFALAVLASLASLALSACQKDTVPPYQDKSGALVKTPQNSVAAPVAAVPAPDASVAPASPSTAVPGTTGTTGTTVMPAGPDTMTKEQESTAMPMAGQANDHSIPAKK